jgi:hypothetical protein
MREAIRELIRGHQRPSEAIREARIEWRRTCRMMREAIKGAQGRSHLQDDAHDHVARHLTFGFRLA